MSVGYIYEPPPSPFETKLPSGTTVNWSDPLSANLVWCWAANEGNGTCLVEAADASHRRNLRWGPDTGVGTGVDKPQWTTLEKALGLRVFGGVSNPQVITQANAPSSTVTPCPPHSFRKGITIEFWGKSLVIGTTSVQYTLMQIGTFNSGNIAELWISSGQNGLPFYDFKYYNTEVAYTPFQFPDNQIFPDHQSLPNHVVATATPNGGGRIYCNGKLIASFPNLVATPFAGDENQVFINLCNNTNFQHGRFDGVFYKASVYDIALGPAAVQALSENPMRVLGVTKYPGIFTGAVPVLPTVTLTATPPSIVLGDSSTLTWTSTDATTLSLDQGIGSVVVPSGSTVVSPVVTTLYTITATNSFGTAVAFATVTVTTVPPPPVGVSSGAILQRDLTKFSDRSSATVDDGNPYSAFATIGSVVLTHPSELALILFLTTEASAVGSHPAIDVLLDEVSATVAAPFENIDAFVADPPVLDAAQTLYNDRFYISRTQQPAVCRHMQVKVTWPSERAANELLTWSVIGAQVSER